MVLATQCDPRPTFPRVHDVENQRAGQEDGQRQDHVVACGGATEVALDGAVACRSVRTN